MRPEITGIRQFSQKVSRYLRSTRPVIVTKRGRPYRVLRPIAQQEVQTLRESAGLQGIVEHHAIGIWKHRWPKQRLSTALVRDMRRREGERSHRPK